MSHGVCVVLKQCCLDGWRKKGNVQCSLRSERVSCLKEGSVVECFLIIILFSTLWIHIQYIFISTTLSLKNITLLKFAMIIRRNGMQGVSKPNFFLSHILSRDELLFDSVSNTAKPSTHPCLFMKTSLMSS